MQNVKIALSSLFLFIVLDLYIVPKRQVEAKQDEMLPLGSLLGSWERRHLYHFKDAQNLENTQQENVDEKTFPEFQIRNKKKKMLSHKKATLKNKHKFKGRRKKSGKRKRQETKPFVKTKYVDVDSKLSNSQEFEKAGKPVDIIVHIKMKE